MEKIFTAFFDFGMNKAENKYIKVTPEDIYSPEKGFGFVIDKDSNNNDMISVNAKSGSGDGIYSDLCIGTADDVPLNFRADVPHSGTFDVKISIGGYDKDLDIIVLSQWRRFVLKRKISAGECVEFEFSVNVCDVHRKDEERFIDRSIRVSVLGKNPVINAIEITENLDVKTIYIGGDSTVTDQSAVYPYNPKSSYCGWGQMLGQYLKKGIAVSNHAQSGLTTQEFMGIHWAVVKERLKKDDYLFLQFGHNDQKVKELDAFGGYIKNLRYYIDYAKSVGAHPVLCTPINRIIFEEDGSLCDLLGEYGMAVRAAAREADIPCIDLLEKTTAYFTAQGDERAWDYFWGDGVNRDYTHTNDLGGDIIARFVAQEIVNKDINGIKEYVRTDITDVENPAPLDPSKRRKPSSVGLKSPDSIGLVNIPKFKDINRVENENVIKELAARGIPDSIKEGIFAPAELLSRKSAVYWAARSAGTDTAVFAGIIGEDDTPVSRCELAALLIESYNRRAPDRAIVGNIENYSDRGDIPDNLLDYVRAANELGVLRGKTETEYMPDSVFSRAEAADIFYRLINTN